MKKNVHSAPLILGAMLAAGLGWNAPISGAQEANSVPAGNGDTNGDATIDISDVVYLLDALFLDGPAPVAIGTPSAMGLPATGQTKCYDRSRAEVPCDGADCPGQDGLYHAGCPMEGRFVDNGDGTVTDNCTGLMWQRDTGDVNGDGRSDEQDNSDWCGALSYCEDLVLAGHDDWRLPNIRELESLVDFSRVNPSIDPIFGMLPLSCWSSTPLAGNPDFAWFVSFSRGTIDDDDGEDLSLYVRAVRSAP
jgi:uncharacterized protein DUF1566